MLSPLVRVDVLASHEAVEATQRRQRRQRGRRHLAGRRARSGGMTAERSRSCSRGAGLIDAARRWKARATAGCAQAPDLKPQAGPRSSPAQHGRTDSPAEARRSYSERPRPSPFRKVEEDQRVGFETVLTLTWLSANRRRSARFDGC